MLKNPKVTPRALTAKEKADRANDIYDSFANYLCFCPGCNYVDKTNMYLMRAEMRVQKLRDEGVKCPNCGAFCMPHRACKGWILGYPLGSTTGFVKF